MKHRLKRYDVESGEDEVSSITTQSMDPELKRRGNFRGGIEWSRRVEAVNTRPLSEVLFRDDSAAAARKGRPCPWIYSRYGKITFVVVSFLTLFVVFKVAQPHGRRVYDENEHAIRSHFDPYANSALSHPYVESVVGMIDSRSSDAQKRAENYYHEHRFQVVKSASSEIVIRDYFARFVPAPDRGGEEGARTFYSLMQTKVGQMKESYEEDLSEDSFLVTMDKCKSHAFLERHDVPTAKTLKLWSGEDQTGPTTAASVRSQSFWKEMKESNEGTLRYVMRCCHIPDHDRVVEMEIDIEDVVSFQANRDAVAAFAEEKFEEQYDDYTRPWHSDEARLSDAATPGLYLVKSYRSSTGDAGLERRSDVSMRLIVEVVWGYPYVASEETSTYSAVYMRDPAHVVDSDAWEPRVDVFEGSYSLFARSPTAQTLPHNVHTWLTKQHMDCVWRIARRAAAEVGSEQLFVDVVVPSEGDCFVDAMSLTNEPFMGLHTRYAARLWTEPITNNGGFKTRDPSDVAVYDA